MNKEISFPDGSKVLLVDQDPKPGEIDNDIVDAVRCVIRHYPGAKTLGSLKTMI